MGAGWDTIRCDDDGHAVAEHGLRRRQPHEANVATYFVQRPRQTRHAVLLSTKTRSSKRSLSRASVRSRHISSSSRRSPSLSPTRLAGPRHVGFIGLPVVCHGGARENDRAPKSSARTFKPSRAAAAPGHDVQPPSETAGAPPPNVLSAAPGSSFSPVRWPDA